MKWRKIMSSMVETRITLKLDEQLKSIYEKIGEIFYEETDDNKVENTLYQELFAEIRKILDEKNLLEDKQLAMQGKKRCRLCQNVLPIESKFCNMCGDKLPEVETITVENAETNINKCLGCGNTLEADAIFCPNCGRKHEWVN